jgi:hypothetical protein
MSLLMAALARGNVGIVRHDPVVILPMVWRGAANRRLSCRGQARLWRSQAPRSSTFERIGLPRPVLPVTIAAEGIVMPQLPVAFLLSAIPAVAFADDHLAGTMDAAQMDWIRICQASQAAIGRQE